MLVSAVAEPGAKAAPTAAGVRRSTRSPAPYRGNQAALRSLSGAAQAKLSVGRSNDPLEQEADSVAEHIMRTPAAATAPVQVSRKCEQCEGEEDKTVHPKRNAESETAEFDAPRAVDDALQTPGSALDARTRAFFEARLSRDLSDVRIHDDATAHESARSIGALAYTVGRDVVFDSGRFAPASSEGRRLLAHELVHVVQQTGGAGKGSATTPVASQRPTRPFVARDNATQTAAVLHAGEQRGSGVEFWPLQVTSTKIGPVTAAGAPLAEVPRRLSVIVGQSMTLTRIAELILPLWNSAAPFTPEGASTPLVTPAITADQLAQALLVYNRYYLRVLSQPAPAMSGFDSGLRLPLPVEIESDGSATVNKDLIQNLAAEFDGAWTPLLQQAASAVAAPPAADLHQSVADFLNATTDADARGIAMMARAVSNAVEARPFIVEAFGQLAPNQFDVALGFMNNAVNAQIGLLASQRDGAAILTVLRAALAAAPATLTPKQQEGLTRANLMLGAVTSIVARPPPFAQPNNISPNGVHMIASFEGFCPDLYDDAMPGCGRGRGNCTIGFGHLVHSGPCNGDNSEARFRGGLTRQQGETLFINELTTFVAAVRTTITVPISQQQFDALVSFHFNTGRLNALAPTINNNHPQAVPGIMNQFVNAHVNGVATQLPGLVSRRAAEGTLFSTGAYPP